MEKGFKKDKFQINLWDFVNLEEVNNALDEHREGKDVATDIRYKTLKITKDGTITLEAMFIPEEY